MAQTLVLLGHDTAVTSGYEMHEEQGCLFRLAVERMHAGDAARRARHDDETPGSPDAASLGSEGATEFFMYHTSNSEPLDRPRVASIKELRRLFWRYKPQ